MPGFRRRAAIATRNIAIGTSGRTSVPLNTSNPAVQAEILKIMGFWIQLGVSGFRMDAVPFVIGTKGADVSRPREQYDMLRAFREFLQWRVGDSIVLAEANVLPQTDMEYFGDAGDRMHMMFNFQVNQNLFYALASGDTRPLARAMTKTKLVSYRRSRLSAQAHRVLSLRRPSKSSVPRWGAVRFLPRGLCDPDGSMRE